jgi:hypothetical protein
MEDFFQAFNLRERPIGRPSSMEFVDLKLPVELCRKVEKRVLLDASRSLEGLVVALLEELSQDAATLDKTEDSLLEQRLRDLGYL